MPPSAHTLSAAMMTAMPQTTKPKIGFSIDSIVGNRNQSNKSPINFSHDSEGSEAPLSPLSDYAYQHSNNSPKHSDIAAAIKLNEYAQLELRNKIKRSMSASPPVMHQQQQQQSNEKSMESDIQRHEIQKHQHENSHETRLSSEDRRSHSPQSPTPTSQHQQQQHHMQKQPIIVPGIPANILRPMQPHGVQLPPNLPAEMMAAQNPFFRLVTFQLLPT